MSPTPTYSYGGNGWGRYQNGAFIGGGPGRSTGSTRRASAVARHSSRSRSHSPAGDRPGSGAFGLLVLAAGIWWGVASLADHARAHHEAVITFAVHAVAHWIG